MRLTLCENVKYIWSAFHFVQSWQELEAITQTDWLVGPLQRWEAIEMLLELQKSWAVVTEGCVTKCDRRINNSSAILLGLYWWFWCVTKQKQCETCHCQRAGSGSGQTLLALSSSTGATRQPPPLSNHNNKCAVVCFPLWYDI